MRKEVNLVCRADAAASCCWLTLSLARPRGRVGRFCWGGGWVGVSVEGGASVDSILQILFCCAV